VGRKRDRWVEPGIRVGVARGEGQGDDPGPEGQVVVDVVVLGRAGADLGRDLVQGEGQDGGGGQLPALAPRTASARPGTMCSTRARRTTSFSSGSVTRRVRPMAITER
jgi:hypothetical protein